MDNDKKVRFFDNQRIRTAWDEEKGRVAIFDSRCGLGADRPAHTTQCEHILGGHEEPFEERGGHMRCLQIVSN